MGLLIGVGGTTPTFAYNYYYGVEWDTTISSPVMTRVGLTSLHQTLPVHSKMRGCLLLDNGTVNYYLNPTDWTKRDNDAASNLDGTDGQVMVEIPEHYRRFEWVGTKRRVLISEYPLPGFTLVPKAYASAYEASLQRSTLKLCSVVNTSVDYRGGNNTSAWDALSKTLLGKPVTNLSRTNLRTYARNRLSGAYNWNIEVNSINKSKFWLYMIEYANMNSQLAVNAQLDANGYRQGGLGNGVTTAVSGEWSNFNANNPFINCGASNSLANLSGEVSISVNDFGGTGTPRVFTVNRYRGIENPFGHIYKYLDGVNICMQADNAGALSKLYVSNSPANFNDINYTGYLYNGNIPRTDGYIKELIFGEYGECIPLLNNGGSTTYWCDYFYGSNLPSSGESLRAVMLGGYADSGANAGLGYARANYAPSNSNAYIGSRLCFIPGSSMGV